jgi:hypothetical protein
MGLMLLITAIAWIFGGCPVWVPLVALFCGCSMIKIESTKRGMEETGRNNE